MIYHQIWNVYEYEPNVNENIIVTIHIMGECMNNTWYTIDDTPPIACVRSQKGKLGDGMVDLLMDHLLIRAVGL